MSDACKQQSRTKEPLSSTCSRLEEVLWQPSSREGFFPLRADQFSWKRACSVETGRRGGAGEVSNRMRGSLSVLWMIDLR